MRALKEMLPSEGEIVLRSRCRRHRRKVRYLLNQFELRQKRHGRWLESHIWHAKRFHMRERWGVKYAYRCSDKSERSTYRLSQRESAVIQEKSWYTHFFKQFSSEADLTQTLTTLNLKPNQHEAEVDGVPIFVLRYNTCLVVQVHPAAKSLCRRFESMQFARMFPNAFEITSKQVALQHIYNVCEPLAFDNDSKHILNCLMEAEFDPQAVPQSLLIPLTLHKPSANFRMNERIFRDQLQSDCQAVHMTKGEAKEFQHLSQTNYYMKHHQKVQKAKRALVDTVKQVASQKVQFSGRL